MYDKMSAVDILLSLEEYLEVLKTYSGEVSVSYKDCYVKDGIFLNAEYGVGNSFYTACEDYLNKIHGKTLVFDHIGERKEVRVL